MRNNPSSEVANGDTSPQIDETSNTSPVDNEPTVTLTQISFEKSEIVSLVNLLTNEQADVQFAALAVLKKFVTSDDGADAVYEAGAIPHLLEVLDIHRDGSKVACQSAIILSHMAQYQHICSTIVNEDAILSLSRLLAHSEDDQVLIAVSQAIGLCGVWNPDKNLDIFSHDALQPLVSLLTSKNQKVWIAAAQAIHHIAKGEGMRVSQYLCDQGAIWHLCHLAASCKDLPALQTLASTVGQVLRLHIVTEDDTILIKRSLVQPLLAFLQNHQMDVQVDACLALRSLIGGCTLARQLPEELIIPDLVPLLDAVDDEVFAEAVLVVLTWTHRSHKYNCQDPPEYINIGTVRRLIRLLTHEKEAVVKTAALGIAEIVYDFSDKFDKEIFDEVVQIEGVGSLIGLLSSENRDVVRASADAIHRLCGQKNRGAVFMRYDLIGALVRQLASVLNPLEPVLEVMMILLLESDGVEEGLLEAGAIPIFLRHLSNPGGKDHSLLRDIVSRLVFKSKDAWREFLDPTAAQTLVQLYSLDDPLPVKQFMIEILLHLTNLSEESGKIYKEAGVKVVFAQCLSDVGEEQGAQVVERLIALLGRDADSDDD